MLKSIVIAAALVIATPASAQPHDGLNAPTAATTHCAPNDAACQIAQWWAWSRRVDNELTRTGQLIREMEQAVKTIPDIDMKK